MENLRPNKLNLTGDTDIQTDKNTSDITILLLGETGVGKSTWINGFANFLQFQSLDEAETNPTLCLIPASFTITDENYEERLISTGEDSNEIMDPGQSATQHPQSYVFPQKGRIVRLIDTPGIGDVRGVEQDKKNFEFILDHISHLTELHAICILLKPNNARLNIMFSFCIKELLIHLHKDACRNIVFCFTNSRSTFYRPGDTLPALRKLLEENKQQVDIKLNISTLYCMDNEAIRFLYAVKAGLQFTPDERKNYIASWEKSVAEINRLLKHAEEQIPHSIENTLSLNKVRQTILALGSPMAEVAKNIQINIAEQEKKKNELLTSEKSKEELSKDLTRFEYDVKMKMLEEPRTVCTAVNCVDFVQVGGVTEVDYKTHCHKNCSRGKEKNFDYINKKGHKKLRKCSAFDRKTGKCKHCNCSWTDHMKTNFETKRVIKTVTDNEKQNEILNEERAMKKIKRFLEDLDKNLVQLRKEQAEITNASVIFAQFLKSNAITPYNDSMDAYLMLFINQEKEKVGIKKSDPKILEGMLQMRQDYNEQMILLEKAMEDGDSGITITPAELENTISNLYKLQNSGKNLMEMMSNSCNYAKSNYTEKRIEKNDSFTTTTTTTRPFKKSGFKAGMKKIGTKLFKDKSIDKEDNVKNCKKSSIKSGIFPNFKSTFEDGNVKYNIPPDKKPPPPPKYPKPYLNQQEKLPTLARPSKEISTKFTPKKIATQPEVVKATSPPPPPIPAISISNERISLLEQIRNPHTLKKTNSNFQTASKNPTKTIPSNSELLKRVLEERALRVQDSVQDDDEGVWDD